MPEPAVSPPSLSPPRKPEWLKVRAPGGEHYRELKRLLGGLTLHTVCEEAHCPNLGECWGGGTATIMLMGGVCTRGCRFCAVRTGRPAPLDPREPEKVAAALERMGLRYVVLTSVDRDDLPDGGAAHFAATVAAIKRRLPELAVEVLIPDFQGDRDALAGIVASGADVVAHNVETVARLTPRVRDRRATYARSLEVLRVLKVLRPQGLPAPGLGSPTCATPSSLAGVFTKSSIMVGLGETADEVLSCMRDLRSVGVDVLTLGQYLRPSAKYLPVAEYVAPARFHAYREAGEELGFMYVASGPLVRSSYRAGEFFMEGLVRRGRAARGAQTGAAEEGV